LTAASPSCLMALYMLKPLPVMSDRLRRASVMSATEQDSSQHGHDEFEDVLTSRGFSRVHRSKVWRKEPHDYVVSPYISQGIRSDYWWDITSDNLETIEECKVKSIPRVLLRIEGGRFALFPLTDISVCLRGYLQTSPKRHKDLRQLVGTGCPQTLRLSALQTPEAILKG